MAAAQQLEMQEVRVPRAAAVPAEDISRGARRYAAPCGAAIDAALPAGLCRQWFRRFRAPFAAAQTAARASRPARAAPAARTHRLAPHRSHCYVRRALRATEPTGRRWQCAGR